MSIFNTGTTTQKVQAVFIGLLGRNAKTGGLNHYVAAIDNPNNGYGIAEMLSELVNTQPEYAANIDGMGRAQVVTYVFNNLFGRNPTLDAEGNNYWINGPGSVVPIDQLVTAIIDGASAADQLVLENKISVATYMQQNPGLTDAQAKAILATVNQNLSSIDAAKAAVDAGLDPTGQEFILTAGQDNITGTDKNDTFKATQNTLQTGDVLNGGAGDDILILSVSGSNNFFAAPTLNNIETIRINAPNVNGIDIELDLSNADGYQTLESFQTTDYTGSPDSAVYFWDIQNVNGTNIRIIDTNLYHEFSYDNNAYVRTAGGVAVGNAIDLYLSEVIGSEIVFSNEFPYAWGQSEADQINITSAQRTQISDTTENTLSGLYVGDMLQTVMIDGNADLEVEDFLDLNVNLVDASELAADLTLSLHAQGVALNQNGTVNVAGTTILNVIGAQGDDDIYIGGARNAGINVVDLGTGNDTLTIALDRSHSFIDTGPGNDYVHADIERGLVDINLGDGNNLLEYWGDVDDLTTLALNDGRSTVTAGSGNDTVIIEAANSYSTAFNDWNISLGGGDDYLEIISSGNQIVDAGSGDDTVIIEGDGYHNIDLGSGDDYLLIDGARLPGGNVDNTLFDFQTTILGGDGNDTVEILGDHYLNVDLGDGDDQIILYAQHLTVDDAIHGGEGRDTLTLRNLHPGQNVIVGISETSSTTSIEVFDLRQQNITLRLSSDNFDTAEDKHITVDTTKSNSRDLPLVSYQGITLSQGISYGDFAILRAAWAADPGNAGLVATHTTLDQYIYFVLGGASSQAALSFVDQTGDLSSPGNAEWTGGTVLTGYANTDRVFFFTEPGAQTVDITGVPLSVASGRSFTLEGGNIRDIVIADDLAINGRLVLNFDANTGAADSTQDTLRVVNGATITAADLRNVTGLEVIELVATANNAQTWQIDLNDRVINQTTGTADLIIKVDPTVPAGSRVDIFLDPSVANATNNVVIVKNGNVDIYIDNVLVTEPDLNNTDYNPGANTIIVQGGFEFTTNTDSLYGTSADDTFVANSLAQLQAADSADGRGGYDTLQLNFAVSNPILPIFWQLNLVKIDDIEHILFETGNNVQAEGLGAWWYPGYEDVQKVTTGYGNDVLTEMEAIGTNVSDFDNGLSGYFLREGDDFISTGGGGEDNTWYIDGGLGDDTIESRNANTPYNGFWWWSGDDIYANDVEHIFIGGEDTVFISQSAELPNNKDVNVTGFNDGVPWWADGQTAVLRSPINGTLFTTLVENVIGSDGDDTIVATQTNNGSYLFVDGEDGDDHITATANTADVNVVGGWGDDTIVVTSNGEVSVQGDYWWWAAGDDSITVNAAEAWVAGGNGDDTITVTTTGDAFVFGDWGNYWWYVNGPGNWFNGGAEGDDVIVVNFGSAVGANEAWVEGGGGNDTITVNTFNDNTATIFGDAGDDTIILNPAANGGTDTVVFGTIEYDALQNQVFNNQGTDTITGFTFEGTGGDPSPVNQDFIDLMLYLEDEVPAANVVTVPGNWDGVTPINANNEPGDAVVILTKVGGGLTPAHFGTGGAAINLNDNGKAVVVVGTDPTGVGTGIQNFEIYFVQDISSGPGQTWAVDLVANVESSTLVGIHEIVDNLIFDQGAPVQNVIAGQPGPQIMTATAAEDVFVLGEFDAVTHTVFSVAPTANSGLSGGADAALVGDTLTYGAGVDVINGFEVGVDKLAVVTPGAPVNAFNDADLVGPAGPTGDLLSTSEPYVLYGNWDQVTNVFTIAQEWTAVTADALVIQGIQGFDPIQESTGATVVTNLAGPLGATDFVDSALI